MERLAVLGVGHRRPVVVRRFARLRQAAGVRGVGRAELCRHPVECLCYLA